ncbi:MAG TPA: hypothetical protein VF070_46120 [Streptosporangiaceae bacterium]
MAALDPVPAAATSVADIFASHRPRGRRVRGVVPLGDSGRFRVLATAAAVALSVALELTGPPRPFLFSLRLPLAVLLIGAGWTEASAWLGARWPGDVARSRKSVPMATPVLILTSTAGVAAVTAKLVSLSPALVFAVFAVASAACCLAVGILVTGGRRQRATRPGNHTVPQADGESAPL